MHGFPREGANASQVALSNVPGVQTPDGSHTSFSVHVYWSVQLAPLSTSMRQPVVVLAPEAEALQVSTEH